MYTPYLWIDRVLQMLTRQPGVRSVVLPRKLSFAVREYFEYGKS